VVHYFLGNR